jgi:2-methylcitrate dehydratase PrpD
LAAYSTAAAACMLGRATARQISGALSLAGCLAPVAPFEPFTEGAGGKDLYGGWGGLVGIMAARLSAVGFAGPGNLFEGARGLGRAWLHAVPSSQDLAAALAAARSGTVSHFRFKPFASCVSAHPALSAIETLRAEHPDLEVDDVARIEVGTYAYAVELSHRSAAHTPICARVNIPYLCAALLLDGVVGAEQAEAPRLSDPRLRDLAAKVTVFEMCGTDTGLSVRRRPACVTVVMQDGRRLEASANGPRWEEDSPPSDADLERKFRQLVGGLMTPARRDALVRTLWRLESVADVGEVVAYLV